MKGCGEDNRRALNVAKPKWLVFYFLQEGKKR